MPAAREPSRTFLLLGLALSFGLSAPPASAARGEGPVVLRLLPRDGGNALKPRISPEMRSLPVAASWEDARGLEDAASLGIRSERDEREQALYARGDVLEHVEAAFRVLAKRWGLRIAAQAERQLAFELEEFRVEERQESFGASYSASVTLRISLRDAGGRLAWSGRASGGASRFGRAYSVQGVNQVLSDALGETLAAALSQPGLQAAWRSEAKSVAPAPPAAVPTPPPATQSEPGEPEEDPLPAPPISPQELLHELRALIQGDFDEATLVDFVKTKTLSRAISAQDLARWREAGVPESVIRAALERPLRDSRPKPIA